MAVHGALVTARAFLVTDAGIFSIADKRISHLSGLAGRKDIRGKQVDYFS
jgi:hypothetical protein